MALGLGLGAAETGGGDHALDHVVEHLRPGPAAAANRHHRDPRAAEEAAVDPREAGRAAEGDLAQAPSPGGGGEAPSQAGEGQGGRAGDAGREGHARSLAGPCDSGDGVSRPSGRGDTRRARVTARAGGDRLGTMPDSPLPDDNAVPDRPGPDRPGPDRPLPDDNAVPDRPGPDRPGPDRPVPDRPVPDRPVPDRPGPDRPVPDRPVPDRPVPDRAVPDRPVPDSAVPPPPPTPPPVARPSPGPLTAPPPLAAAGRSTLGGPDRWVGLLAMVGVGLVVVVATQVLGALVQGFTLDGSQNQPQGVPTDLLHRLGYPFGALGPPTLALLVGGLVLLFLPDLLRRPVTPFQGQASTAGVVAVAVLALILAIGSLLAVRYSLHSYSYQNGTIPTFIRIQIVIFLLGSLGPSVVALCGAIVGLRARRAEARP